MSVKVFNRDTCRLCGSKDQELGLSLTPTPIGDEFVRKDRLGTAQETFSLDLFVCGDCGAVQLLKTLDPEVIYGDYMYTSSISVGLPEHFQRYAAHVADKIKPAPGGLVVELGSNEGAMLRAFKTAGMKVLGIDPASEIAKAATAAGLETMAAFFSSELAGKIRAERGAASIVVANNVFANIDDLADMAQGVRQLLADDGVFVFESSYLLDVAEKDLIDTVFHEHLSYFAVKPLGKYFERNGLQLFDVERVPTKGGSLRGYVQIAGGMRPVTKAVAELEALETKAEVDKPAALRRMGERLQTLKSGLHALLDGEAKGKSVASFGAAVGLTTMIYHFDLAPRIEYIVDDNPGKQGTFSPGHHIPVVSPEEMLKRRPDYVVLLAWRYADGIIERNRAYLDSGGHFIIPLPALTVV